MYILQDELLAPYTLTLDICPYITYSEFNYYYLSCLGRASAPLWDFNNFVCSNPK